MNCKTIIPLIHRYLDDAIDIQEEQILIKHMSICSECHKHLMELEKSIALFQSLSHVRTKDNFTDQALASLPKEQKRVIARSWAKRHPFTIAASIFLFLMMGSSLLSWYGGEQQLEILSSNTHSLIIENGNVIVPEDKVIEGDLVVKYGNIQVFGKVKGDAVAVNGDVLLASTAYISGETEEINQVLEWIWYRIKSFGKDLLLTND